MRFIAWRIVKRMNTFLVSKAMMKALAFQSYRNSQDIKYKEYPLKEK